MVSLHAWIRTSRCPNGTASVPEDLLLPAAQGGPEGLAGSDKAWALPLGAAVLGARQLGLSGWEPAECLALENELGAWQQAGHLTQRLPALRYGQLLYAHCAAIRCCYVLHRTIVCW